MSFGGEALLWSFTGGVVAGYIAYIVESERERLGIISPPPIIFLTLIASVELIHWPPDGASIMWAVEMRCINRSAGLLNVVDIDQGV